MAVSVVGSDPLCEIVCSPISIVSMSVDMTCSPRQVIKTPFPIRTCSMSTIRNMPRLVPSFSYNSNKVLRDR